MIWLILICISLILDGFNVKLLKTKARFLIALVIFSIYLIVLVLGNKYQRKCCCD